VGAPQVDDFALKEKDLLRQVKALEEDKAVLEKTGAAKQQETQKRIKKCGRRVLQVFKGCWYRCCCGCCCGCC
jgi:hypothetical protein